MTKYLDTLLGWLDRRAHALLSIIAAVVVVSRVVLVAYSPWAYGYVYDPYFDGVEKLYDTGHIPESTACYECYHPPLYLLASLPFYTAGRLPFVVHFFEMEGWSADTSMLLMQAVPLLSSLICLWYSYRLLRLFRCRGALVVVGTGIAAALPVVFISSFALEPDMLLAAIVTMFAYYATRWDLRARAAGLGDVARLGALAGLAAATKYSGLATLVVGVLLLGANAIVGPGRRRAALHLALFLVVASAIGSWKYVSNIRHYGTPLYATGTVAAGFSPTPAASYRHLYQFTTFRVRELLELTRPDAPPGMLTLLPVYRSFWTTLHGLMWGDMGFFNNPTRHGMNRALYESRHIPPWLASAVLLLGLVPTTLAGVGFVRTLLRRRFRAIALLCVVGFSSYLHWVVAQRYWAIKTKYLLFLLPAYVLYLAFGTRWAVRVLPGRAGAALVASLIVLIILADLYLFSFAIG